MRKSEDVAIDPRRDENSPRHLGEWQIRSFFLCFFEKKGGKAKKQIFRTVLDNPHISSRVPNKHFHIYCKYYKWS